MLPHSDQFFRKSDSSGSVWILADEFGAYDTSCGLTFLDQTGLRPIDLWLPDVLRLEEAAGELVKEL